MFAVVQNFQKICHLADDTCRVVRQNSPQAKKFVGTAVGTNNRPMRMALRLAPLVFVRPGLDELREGGMVVPLTKAQARGRFRLVRALTPLRTIAFDAEVVSTYSKSYSVVR